MSIERLLIVSGSQPAAGAGGRGSGRISKKRQIDA